MSEKVNRIFSKIASSYDILNTLFSLGIDGKWRAETASAAMLGKKKYRILDVAAGTGTLTLALSKEAERNGKQVSITAMDFNSTMLGIARRKFQKLEIGHIKLERGDALRMKYRNGSFDVVCSAFSLRNFDDIGAFLKESRRVLKPNGRLVLLEMAMPDKPSQRLFFNLYSKLMKLVGSLVNAEAYGWLVESIKKFDKSSLVAKLTKNGYAKVKLRNLTSGVAFLVTAEKRV